MASSGNTEDAKNEEASSLHETSYYEENGAYVSINTHQIIVSGSSAAVLAYLARFFAQYDPRTVWNLLVSWEPPEHTKSCSGDGNEVNVSGAEIFESEAALDGNKLLGHRHRKTIWGFGVRISRSEHYH
ncbi:hypothetical protein PspLS_11413 [Pyricularia sp. CBS 133598]|nr:hypothetical protein PspLS_11413 [Pyricularia sp. CBS 133598]